MHCNLQRDFLFPKLQSKPPQPVQVQLIFGLPSQTKNLRRLNCENAREDVSKGIGKELGRVAAVLSLTQSQKWAFRAENALEATDSDPRRLYRFEEKLTGRVC